MSCWCWHFNGSPLMCHFALAKKAPDVALSSLFSKSLIRQSLLCKLVRSKDRLEVSQVINTATPERPGEIWGINARQLLDNWRDISVVVPQRAPCRYWGGRTRLILWCLLKVELVLPIGSASYIESRRVLTLIYKQTMISCPSRACLNVWFKTDFHYCGHKDLFCSITFIGIILCLNREHSDRP